MNDNNKTKAQLIAEMQAVRKERDDLQNRLSGEKGNSENQFFRTKFYKELFNRSPMSIQILDKNGVSIAVNPAHTALFKEKPYEGYNLFNEPQLLNQGFGSEIEKLKKGEPVNLENSYFNPHLCKDDFIDNLLFLDGYAFAILGDDGKPENFVFMHKDITDRIKLEEERKKNNQQLIENAQSREIERAKISEDIHDELSQVLSYIKIKLGRLQKKINEPEAKAEVNELYNLVDNSITSIHRMLSSLNDDKFEAFGIRLAIETYCHAFEIRTGIKITTKLPPELNLPHKMPGVIYRILKESLTNVFRHARAENAFVTLKTEDQKLYFSVRDDGMGIDNTKINSPLSLGINGMKDKINRLNGDFNISKATKKGTIINIIIPLQNISL
jgi:signal transduction histidine kinase